ncbi:MAG TPA: carboxypeptidase regulatory-like domain-containing protein [Candidatus Acidoferrales bacterium]|nr:carboxypeptidase regulatory-like domain-containing protein [Candidatus Acidoferrales bacterium]
MEKESYGRPAGRGIFFWFCIAVALLLFFPGGAWGQGETTSAILGQVTDATGAAIPGASVTITNRATGLERSARTDDQGRFNFPQLLPGTYSVAAAANGFQPQRLDNVVAGLGQKQTVNFTLQVSQSRQTVEVSGEAPLINPENANTSTTLSAPALENLPNPGGDLTYPLQFSAGALMNTAGSGNDFVGGTNGYGNVEFNGLPALSNGYIVDGLETNDPLTNLNSGLSTNLVLGINSISEVTVNTLSYSVDQGRYGASQVNYVTKSGTNKFHGNLYEIWNGSILNAADFFTNATLGNHKPRSTVNHFGGSLGGPIAHNKLFFFVDSEWVRIALPIVTPTTVPTLALKNYILPCAPGVTSRCGQLALGGVDSVLGLTYPAAPQLVPFYQGMFALYGNTSGTPLPVLGCPFNADGTSAAGNPPNGNGCANRQSISHSSDDREQVQTFRMDYNIDAKNTSWFRFQADTGLQAAYTDPINPLFDSISPQPLYSFAAGYTHVFSQNLVNYFNPGFSWYESLFAPGDFEKTLSAFPIVLQGSGANAFTPVGGLDNTWLQGRRATRYFLNDNLAWSHRSHELRFGTNTRIFRLNDYDFGEGSVPTVTYATLPQFIYGVASTATKTFPLTANEPFRFLNLDVYAQDTWRVTSKLTWTFGLRDTFNSNPLNPHDQVARLPGSFASISHGVSQPLSEAIQTHLGNLFSSTPLAILQPRTAIAWQFAPGSVLRAGFGLFSDLLPGSIADLIGTNPPYVRTFEGGLHGTVGQAGTVGCDPVLGCTGIAPGVSNSSIDTLIAANQAFTGGFAQGSLSCAFPYNNCGGNLPPVAITAVPDGTLHAPYFMEWSLGIEHQFGNTASVRAQYVGTRALNQPYLTQVNGYQNVCAGCFAPFPYLQPVDPRFGAATQLSTGAGSHYNGLQLTAMKRLGHGLEGQINYTFSRCMDEVSNGGFLQFSAGAQLAPLPGELSRDYGPCDYDVRHNLTGQYSYQLPVHVRSRGLGYALNGWQLSGTFVWHSGLPFSVLSAPYSAPCPQEPQGTCGIVDGGGLQFASVVPGVPLYDHHPIPGVTQAGSIQWLNPNAFVSTVDPSTGACNNGANPPNDSAQICQFGNLGRNALRGPQFVWSDFYLTKWFPISERVKLRVEGQFFNVFNHANFGLPSDVIAGNPKIPTTLTGFGALTYATSPPTGLLGVGLGGDSSPRMIAIQARLEF